ncbi:MAG: hypothetical protein FJX48_01020, partial [Alphaproteobacteria bacterium]|nr:hypothetical protein [Alphaproteobacteria bacterium]
KIFSDCAELAALAVAMRRIFCTTNAIESLNAKPHRAAHTRGKNIQRLHRVSGARCRNASDILREERH